MRHHLQNCPVDYDDNVEKKLTHPKLLPMIDSAPDRSQGGFLTVEDDPTDYEEPILRPEHILPIRNCWTILHLSWIWMQRLWIN
jgi:hypothetical protein